MRDDGGCVAFFVFIIVAILIVWGASAAQQKVGMGRKQVLTLCGRPDLVSKSFMSSSVTYVAGGKTLKIWFKKDKVSKFRLKKSGWFKK